MKKDKPKTKIPQVKKRVLTKRTGFEKIHEKRMRTELHLRTITQYLKNLNDWLPHLPQIQPGIQPAEIIRNLQHRRIALIKQSAALRKQEEEKFGQPPDQFCFEPTLEDIEKMRQGMRVLEKLDSAGNIRVFEEGVAGEPQCSLWSGVLWSLEPKEYETIWWSEDDDATYQKVWHFNPYYDVHRGILYGRFSVNNPAPFDWPKVEEEHDWSQLVVTLALPFDVPAPDCDAQVFYQANMALGLSTNYDARDYMHFVRVILCEQPDINTGNPSNLSDFETVGDSIWNEPGQPLQQHQSVHVARSYSVRAGIRSRIHLGFTCNLSVASGTAGTSSLSWDNLVIFRPPEEDCWGVKVTMIPV